MYTFKRLFYCLVLSLTLNYSYAQNEKTYRFSNDNLEVVFSQSGLVSLTSNLDSYKANLFSSEWNRPDVSYRVPKGDWLGLHYYDYYIDTVTENSISYTNYIPGLAVKLTETYTLIDKGLDRKIELENLIQFPITIGDFSISVPTQFDFETADPEQIFEHSYIKHHFIAGDASFMHFVKPSGTPPIYMVMTKPGTKLEYFDAKNYRYKAYVHSMLTNEKTKEGTWRQEPTSGELEPAGSGHEKLTYEFRIAAAGSWQDAREKLYENNLFDIRVVPGMTLPMGLSAKFALHTQNKIDSIVAEFPSQTIIKKLGEKKVGYKMYEATFNKLGENKLEIYYQNQQTQLEFFVTESMETLLKKRASFIVNHQQHKAPEKWYDGLYSIYDMKNAVLRGPDNTDGYDHWWGYVLACDDPALCKAPSVAAKNVYYPDKEEVASLEYYLENFVWGGLQRTDTVSRYPYGIYGTPNWKVNQDELLRAGVKNRNLDKMNIWRSYDYPHIFMLYYHMYQIAEFYPELTHYLDADAYLERAWQTAKAYFTYPYEILPEYEIYKWGCYNELVLEDIMKALKTKGRNEEANWLRKEYEKKVKYFIYDDKYPYRSEYSIDRTAFESSYALARYGANYEMQPDTNLWWDINLKKWHSHPKVSKQDALDFMDKQHYAGLAVRGWLEPKYYLLGSDFTYSSNNHCLTYMAIMGGWSILDYGIKFSKTPYDWLQLGYASYLSSWALMNTGTAESNYGYWFPGKENDGAAGWAFMSSKHAPAWIRKVEDRGPYRYDGEIDLGYGAAFRMASTVLTNDPLFGRIAYGGKLTTKGNTYSIIPCDGLRARFYLVDENKRMGITLERDGFKKGTPIQVNKKLFEINFTIENRAEADHETLLFIDKIKGYEPKEITVYLNGEKIDLVESTEINYTYNLKITGLNPKVRIVF